MDGRADIYSLAKITYYMLTGKNPHQGRSPRELFQQLLNGKAVPLSEAREAANFPAALETAVMKALARQPADRQPTVTAFADELEAAVAQSKDAKSRGWLGTLKNIVGKRDSE